MHAEKGNPRAAHSQEWSEVFQNWYARREKVPEEPPLIS
jgi:hypothetical protein